MGIWFGFGSSASEVVPGIAATVRRAAEADAAGNDDLETAVPAPLGPQSFQTSLLVQTEPRTVKDCWFL